MEFAKVFVDIKVDCEVLYEMFVFDYFYSGRVFWVYSLGCFLIFIELLRCCYPFWLIFGLVWVFVKKRGFGLIWI